MNIFTTLLFAAGEASGSYLPIILIVGFGIVIFLSWRSSKKQERETQQMRNSLEVGDEITTIGGIIGEIVRIKEETVTIETGKDRTKIRVLRSAIRSVDVYAAEKRGETKKPEANSEKPQESESKSKKIKLDKANLKENKSKKSEKDVVIEDTKDASASEVSDASNDQNTTN